MNPIAEKTGKQLIEAARQLGPVLRERAHLAEQLRRVPDETFEDIQRAGLLQLLKPSRFGGLEMGLEEYVAITTELSRHCSATGWAFSLLCEHNIFVSLFPLEAQEDVWGSDSYAAIAASIYVDPARAVAARVPGGFRLSGKFGFASGSDHAKWLMLAALAEPEPGRGSEPEVRFFLIPKQELTPVDDWFVLGMRGTGSHSWLADDVFVPEHRTTARMDLVTGKRGAELHPTFNLVHYGRGPITTYVVSGPIAGIAQGAVERFTEIAASSSRVNAGRVAESEVTQLALAESAAEAFAARALIDRGAHEQMELVRAYEPVPEELQHRLSRDSAYVGVLARRCIERLHVTLGSQAIFEGHPLQQALRDVHTAVAQAGMNWERLGVRYGRFAMDVPMPPSAATNSQTSYVR